MKDLEREFEEMVRKNRGTIYTVCYMFSNDQDEVADLLKEVLINLWKSLPSFEGRSDVRVLKGTVNSDVPRHQKCSLAVTKVETASTDDKTAPMDNKTASTDDKTETMFSSSSFCITKVPSIMPPNWGRLQRINVVVDL